ncbi:MAG: hypothetical protein OEX97_01030 [Acidimicrobiia bacterium]|nr:hypothetical protein [Acidimicrobiia bacterium]
MTIVFGILVIYALSFLLLALAERGADRLRSRVAPDQPLELPIRLPVGTTPDTPTQSDLAV